MRAASATLITLACIRFWALAYSSAVWLPGLDPIRTLTLTPAALQLLHRLCAHRLLDRTYRERLEFAT
jgi:hypothetical protein